MHVDTAQGLPNTISYKVDLLWVAKSICRDATWVTVCNCNA